VVKYLVIVVAVALVLITSSLVTTYLITTYLTSLSRSRSLSSTSLLTEGLRNALVSEVLNPTYVLTNSSTYSRLNYPVIHLPKYVAHYYVLLSNYSLSIGFVRTYVIDLVRAYEVAIKSLPRGNYDLVRASLIPGKVVNDYFIKVPTWELVIARTYCGFRVWGSDYLVVINAINASVVKVYPSNYPELPEGIDCSYFRINYPRVVSIESLIKYVRELVSGSNYLGSDVKEIVKYGHLSSVDLRLVRVGPWSRDLLTMKSLRKDLIGKWLLCWVVTFVKSLSRVTLLIDATHGELVNYVKEPNYPPTPWYTFQLGLANPVSNSSLRTDLILSNGSVLRAYLVIPKAVTTEVGSEGLVTIEGSWRTYGGVVKELPKYGVKVCFLRSLSSESIKVVPIKECVKGYGRINLSIKYYIPKNVSKGLHAVAITLKVIINNHEEKDIVAIPFIIVARSRVT